MSKLYVNSKELFRYSSELGKLVAKDYKPDAIIGLSRGGNTPSIIIHELLNHKGINCKYFNMSCKSYNQDNIQSDECRVNCSQDTLNSLQECSDILIVDDVFDTGITISNILSYLSVQHILSYNIKVATIFYKPSNNKTTITPNYYIITTSDWIVFPHEYIGLTDFEISQKINHENNS
tara:strand:+ start:432 stop:965 length:534 start_codon:yes stop_codon:yes gene_type:complete